MMTDPIADMLTRIRNAQEARHEKVSMPSSKVKEEILRILAREGYIDAIDVSGDKKKRVEVTLRYYKDEPVIRFIKRESTPGRRVYVASDEIPKVLGGLGLAVVSTPKGMMSGGEAQTQGMGGELICTVY